jgi:hypothetical protein
LYRGTRLIILYRFPQSGIAKSYYPEKVLARKSILLINPLPDGYGSKHRSVHNP